MPIFGLRPEQQEMTPSLKERLPLFELSLILVAGIIGWAEFKLLKIERENRQNIKEVGQETKNRLERESQRFHHENQRMQQVLSELQLEFTNGLTGLDKAQMEDAFKLPDAFKLQEEYWSIAEGVDSGVNDVHTSLTNFVSRRSAGALARFQRRSQDLKNWVAKEEARSEVERFQARSRELKDWIRREQPPGAPPLQAMATDLGTLLAQVAQTYTNYLADAQYAIDNLGKPITGERVAAHLNSAGQAAARLFELARQSRMDGKAMQTFLQSQWRSEAQQRASQLQIAVVKAQAILKAQARLETNDFLIAENDLNSATRTTSENQFLSSSFSTALYPLLFAQMGLGVFLLAAIYRRVVVEKLRARLYESTTENKLAHFEKVAVWQAHELKQPLTAITAWLWTLQESLTKGTPEHTVATAIRKETDRLDQIVKDFLNLARPLEPKLVPVKAESTLREIQQLFQPRLQQQSIKLNLESAVDARFRADPQQLKQVLTNLVQNAAESIQHDGAITLRARQDKVPLKGRTTEAVIIEVEDNGPGIPQEVQERLFEPFFSTKQEGTGLGLPIAARIIDKHGGALEFTSSPGKGTTFGVVLPVCHDGE